MVIKGKLVHQLKDVLRLRGGDHIAVLDDTGWEYEMAVARVTRDHVAGVICGKRPVAEPGTRITLYQALLKGSKFEFILQKCTELGVSGFVPVICERCVAGHPKDKKGVRWRRIIAEAAEQSGRGKLPRLEPAVPFQQACRAVTGFSLLAWEEAGRDNEKGENALGLRPTLRSEIPAKNPLAVNLFIGPEGGFTPSEVGFARNCGILPITLGSRVLRAETAGLVAATAILYEYGDLDLLPSD